MLPTPTFEELRNSGAEPKWFGLGFIQIKLDHRRRMHFWHPELSADTPEEELHDHRYDFNSRVVLGEITHEVYSLNEILELRSDSEFLSRAKDELCRHAGEAVYTMVNVSCKPGVAADPMAARFGTLRLDGSYTMKAGSEYMFPSHGFHRIKTERAITYLERGKITHDLATVIRPTGGENVCPFGKTVETETLWRLIEELMAEAANPLGLPIEQNPGYHLNKIPRGELGEASKVLEEVLEFVDANRQGAKIMEMIELSDLQGAVKAYLSKHCPDITMEDLTKMQGITERAFTNGHR